jgi:hypothetical protein
VHRSAQVLGSVRPRWAPTRPRPASGAMTAQPHARKPSHLPPASARRSPVASGQPPAPSHRSPVLCRWSPVPQRERSRWSFAPPGAAQASRRTRSEIGTPRDRVPPTTVLPAGAGHAQASLLGACHRPLSRAYGVS